MFRLKVEVSKRINHVIPRKFLSPIRRFSRDGHNELLFQNLNLNPNSTVLDFGGYVGDFADEICRRFDSNVLIFEPVQAFVTLLKNRFEDNEKVKIYDYAVGLVERDFYLDLNGEGTSEFGGAGELSCTMRSVAQTLIPGIKSIDLIAINIEGGEFELIPALSEAGVMRNVNQLLVQFHKVGPNFVEKRARMQSIIGQTHFLEWNYDFVWEMWRRLPDSKVGQE